MHWASALGLITALVAQAALAAPNKAPKPACLPVVDLGYELHQALKHNETTDVYKFSNIRYAQAPVGDLRWRSPKAPKTDRSAPKNGDGVRTCPQGVPDWQSRAFIPTGRYTGGVPWNLTTWVEAIDASTPFDQAIFNGNVTEDCLFLDLHVPGKVLSKAIKNKKGSRDVPVLVFIHGAGYTFSSKIGHPTPGFQPDGLLRAAHEANGKGMIFISLNYRLGALGFLAGPEVRADGNENAGLLDQRFALEWIQNNVHLFGGDRDKVTVMGESAGGGSIMLHMSAYQHEGKKAPFAQAILQSPATLLSAAAPPSAYNDFLSLLNVTTLAEARQLPSSALVLANQEQCRTAAANTYIHIPVQDPTTAPLEPLQAFNRGAFATSPINLLAAHNSREGAFFFDPTARTEADFLRWVKSSFAGLSTAEIASLAAVVYPPVYDGSQGYVDLLSRMMHVWGDALFDCNFLYANEAFGGRSFACEYLIRTFP
ncbi:Alpha/Beta hydrolase protein [Chaetomium fimeti]|uniref:Carboxylic ester hydrolase n=1 Tax=Chaetomium fimeti TaxID=1854472 RepID=A0AAE0H7Z6_9PEZI|nr:Alpha/Beta hydrolase protein [Chaetomium fimeti]